MTTLVWFREDLRLFDNPALHFAASKGDIIPVFIYPEGLGGASYWWLNQSLKTLISSFADHGIELILKKGKPEKILPKLANKTSATAIVWNRVYSPKGIEQGAQIKRAFCESDIHLQSFNGQLLIEPSKVLNKQGLPYKVFTPFWRYCTSILNPSDVLPIPKLTQTGLTQNKQAELSSLSDSLGDWGLHPTQPDWSRGLAERWQPGEQGAQQRLTSFLENAASNYKDGRDFPSQHNTSYLAPHLAFGEISAKQIWFDTHQAINTGVLDATNGNKFLSEIGWREFSRYLLVHFPQMITSAFNQKFDQFPWQDSPDLLNAWQRGQTGYPIVDAGMRELWHTGYMHNRVRMISASFLTKHCLTHWQAGMDWFWETLVDADIANNTASWQWVSGCGADAAPYFRIFNPILQGEKFDKQGDYIKKWIPELADLSPKLIHKPWQADPLSLQQANVQLGVNYPHPIVDHKEAREQALSAYTALKNSLI